ncbi:MAG: hypothetical protein ABI661_10385 [Gammaproteobacteria bacterium]
MPDGMLAEMTSGGDVRVKLPRAVLKESETGPNQSLILVLSRQHAATLRDILNERLGMTDEVH